jgi:hypothetical protein
MDIEVKVLETDEEFNQMIPLIIEFCKKTNLSISQSFYEITNGLTFLAKRDGKITGYLNGIFLSKTEFFIHQAYRATTTKDNTANLDFVDSCTDQLAKLGCTKITMQTKLSPEMFEQYGFKFNHYLLIKEIEIKEE